MRIVLSLIGDGSWLQNEADAYRKIRLRVEDVQGRNVLTNFWVGNLQPISLSSMPNPINDLFFS